MRRLAAFVGLAIALGPGSMQLWAQSGVRKGREGGASSGVRQAGENGAPNGARKASENGASENAQRATIRRLAALAPEDCGLWLRVRGLHVDLGRVHALAERALRDVQKVGVLFDARGMRRLRAALTLARGLDRNQIAIAVRELLAADTVFGLAGRSREAFAIAKLSSEELARRCVKPLRGVLRLPITRHGRFLFWSQNAERCAGLVSRLEELQKGAAANARSGRIVRELPEAEPIALWLDMQSAIALPLRRALNQKAKELGNGLLNPGIGKALAQAAFLSAKLEVAGDKSQLVIRLPAIEGHLAKSTRAVLGLEAEPIALPARRTDEILRFRLQRGLGPFFRAHKSFVRGKGLRDVQSFLAGVEQIFQGANLVEDLLVEWRPGIAGVLVQPKQNSGADLDRAQLPRGAIIGEFGGRRFADALSAAMQVLGLIVNNDRGRRLKLPFRLQSQRYGELRVLTATPRSPRGERPPPAEADVEATLARNPRHFALGSSRELCIELVKAQVSRPLLPGSKLAPSSRPSKPTSRPSRARRSTKSSAAGSSADKSSLSQSGVAKSGASKSPESNSRKAASSARWRGLDYLSVDFAAVAKALLRNSKSLQTRLLLDRGLTSDESQEPLAALSALLARLGRVELETGLQGVDAVLRLDWAPALGDWLATNAERKAASSGHSSGRPGKDGKEKR